MDNVDRSRIAYYEAREAYEKAKAAAETAHLNMQNAERSVVDEMLARKLPSLKVGDGTQMDLRPRSSTSPHPKERESENGSATPRETTLPTSKGCWTRMRSSGFCRPS